MAQVFASAPTRLLSTAFEAFLRLPVVKVAGFVKGCSIGPPLPNMNLPAAPSYTRATRCGLALAFTKRVQDLTITGAIDALIGEQYAEVEATLSPEGVSTHFGVI